MKEKCNCIGGCAKPILNEQVMKCQDDVVKREMIQEEINEALLFIKSKHNEEIPYQYGNAYRAVNIESKALTQEKGEEK